MSAPTRSVQGLAGLPAIPAEYLNQIVTGDARELAKRIPDESVDLIFTDPVYERLEDYEWLAIEAARVLKPNGDLLVWCPNLRYFEIKTLMEGHIKFRAPLLYVKTGAGYMMWHLKLFVKSTPCLWFGKGNAENKGLPDTIVSTQPPPPGSFKWNKNPEAFVTWMRALTDVGAIVYDPFTGGGTVPAVCKMLSRNFIASEIDPDTAERARLRVEQTQPPLPGLVYETPSFLEAI